MIGLDLHLEIKLKYILTRACVSCLTVTQNVLCTVFHRLFYANSSGLCDDVVFFTFSFFKIIFQDDTDSPKVTAWENCGLGQTYLFSKKKFSDARFVVVMDQKASYCVKLTNTVQKAKQKRKLYL